MATIILPSQPLYISDTPQPPDYGSSKRSRVASFSATRDSSISWGRSNHYGSWVQSLGCTGIMLLCPCLVIFYWITLSSFQGSFTAAYNFVWELGFTDFVRLYAPRPTITASVGYGGWLIFHGVLYQFLPSKLSHGQLTPAGYLLKYRTNGLLAWFVTHALYVAASASGYLDPAIIAKNWEGLLVAVNVFGFLLTGFAYVKACFFPTHEDDNKFSGSVIYDMYMGVELNPRIGKLFDFKLFTNGRPGIIAWTLIDLSFIAYQYQSYGYVTKSILVATALHLLYVVDFFFNEDWYLRTIDICHDHFGFYLAWGSVVWLPCIYTLQTQYLARNPVFLSYVEAVSVLLAGLSGYTLFRCVNYQKDLVRRTKGDCKLWGSQAQVVRVKYKTTDGVEHDSLLLCSGWWGVARHVNYLGDLVLSFSMCATCGFQNILPWTYGIFMTILLIHRCWRDEERCSMKYGKGWEEYCERVRWAIIPGVY